MTTSYLALETKGPQVPFNDLRSSTKVLNAAAPWVVAAGIIAVLAAFAIAAYFLCTTSRTIEECDPKTGTESSYQESNWDFTFLAAIPVGFALLILGTVEGSRRVANYNLHTKLPPAARDAYIERLKMSSLNALYMYHGAGHQSLMSYVPEIYTAEEAHALNALFNRYTYSTFEARQNLEAGWLDTLMNLQIIKTNEITREQVEKARIKAARETLAMSVQYAETRHGVHFHVSAELMTPETIEIGHQESEVMKSITKEEKTTDS